MRWKRKIYLAKMAAQHRPNIRSQVNSKTCRRVFKYGEARHKLSALRFTPQFETVLQRHKSCVILARFDLPPFTSFQPLPLFTLLPHYGFLSFEDLASLSTTGIPSFISTLRFRAFFTFFFLSTIEEPMTYTDKHRPKSRSCWQTLRAQPGGCLGQALERVAECINMVTPTTNRLHYD